jgi:hypothetical protein
MIPPLPRIFESIKTNVSGFVDIAVIDLSFKADLGWREWISGRKVHVKLKNASLVTEEINECGDVEGTYGDP